MRKECLKMTNVINNHYAISIIFINGWYFLSTYVWNESWVNAMVICYIYLEIQAGYKITNFGQ